MRHVKALTLMFLLFIIPSIFTNEIGTEYVKNPVFVPSNGQQAKNPCVVYDQPGFESANPATAYKMWFATEDGIGLAYSVDGLAWTEYNSLQPLIGLQLSADLPYVIYDKGGFGGTNYHYRIWYWSGINDSIEAIRTAESIDGIVWENDRPVQQHISDTSLQLVINPDNNNEYFHHCYGPGSVLYNPNGTDIGSSTPADKSDDQPMTYRYVIYYNSSSEGLSPEGGGVQTSLAYSTDGLYWTRYGNKPVIRPYRNLEKQNVNSSYNAKVIQSDGKYIMLYSYSDIGSEMPLDASPIRMANSNDGIFWMIGQKAGLNLKNNSDPNLSTIYGYSIIPKMIRDKKVFGMWASIAEETTKSSISYYEIDLGRNTLTLGGYWEGATVGYAPFNAHFIFWSGSADRYCTMADEQIWHWDFGDGNSVEGNLLGGVDHTYPNPGTFTVSVDISCYGITADSEQRTIYVKSQPYPEPCGGPKEIRVDKCSGQAPFPFIAWIEGEEMTGCLYSGSDPYWVWDFGDGTIEDGWELWTVTHTYERNGIYTIRARGFCGYNNFAFQDKQQIVVGSSNPDQNPTLIPIPCFTLQYDSSFAPAAVNFDTSCTFIPGTITIVSYLWDFGDGQQASGTDPSMNHEYLNPGRYTISLQITDSTGKTYSYSQTITVKGLFAPSGITLEKQVNKSLFSAKAKNVLKWSPNSLIFECTVVKYNIYRKLSSQAVSEYQLISSVDGNTYSFIDENIELKESYSYVLTAVETGGLESPFSNPVQ